MVLARIMLIQILTSYMVRLVAARTATAPSWHHVLRVGAPATMRLAGRADRSVVGHRSAWGRYRGATAAPVAKPSARRAGPSESRR